MRATVVEEYGHAGVLRISDLPVPLPGPGQVAIDVAYAGVNFAEVMARRGALAPFRPPFVPGLDVSGTVRALGDGVGGLSVGQAVSALTTRGGYAEVVVAPAALVQPLDDADDETLRQGAARPTIVPTAWALLHEVARVRGGETVLVHAAAGGVGVLAGQLAKHVGASLVLGVTSSAVKATYAMRFGYDDVLVGPRWPELARTRLDGAGVDVVLDSVGGRTRAESYDLLAPLGRLVCFGNASGAEEIGIPGSSLRARVTSTLGWSITALAAADPERVRRIAHAAYAGIREAGVGVEITHVFDLADAPSAHIALESRSSVGKLLLAVGAAR